MTNDDSMTSDIDADTHTYVIDTVTLRVRAPIEWSDAKGQEVHDKIQKALPLYLMEAAEQIVKEISPELLLDTEY